MTERTTGPNPAAETATATGPTRPPASPADFYKQCLEMAHAAERNGDLSGALDWLRQAQYIGTAALKREELPEVAAAYATLLVSACRSARRLAVRSGNIHHAHENIVAHIKVFSERLKGLVSDKEPMLVARVAIIEGYVNRLATSVTASRGYQVGRTPAEVVEQVLADLAAIVANVLQLGFRIDAPYGTSAELLELARIAVANADANLFRFFSSLSDWSQARFMCRQAMQLLSQDIKLEGSAAASSAVLEHIYHQLAAADSALGQKNYKQASGLLKAAEKALSAPIATR